MSKNKKRRFWVPAAICVTAFLVAVSMLKPSNITGVFADENDPPAIVEPVQTQENTGTEGGTEGTEGGTEGTEGGTEGTEGGTEGTEGGTEGTEGGTEGTEGGTEGTEGGTEGTEGEIPADIDQYSVATLTVTSQRIMFDLGQTPPEHIYYKLGDGAITEFHDREDISVTDQNMVLYSKNAITNLNMYDGSVSAIDVSKLTDLTTLGIMGSLKSIDLSNNTKLENLYLAQNNLESINLTKNAALKDLNLSNNKLKSIDLSGNPELLGARLDFNQLTSIDLSKNTKLTSLEISENKLTGLDLSKQTALTDLFFYDNQITSFDAVKCPMDKLVNYGGTQSIAKLPESVKAGEKIDLSSYKEYNKKKSYYNAYYYKDENTYGDAIPDSDKDLIMTFGNAYADMTVNIWIANNNSPVEFNGQVQIVKNPDAPAAPEKATGDVPVKDITGTIKSADAADKFDAQLIEYNPETQKFFLGEKVKKEDLTLSFNKINNTEPYYDLIAKADKNFKKDTARLLVYDMYLSYNEDRCLVKLTGGINFTLNYPADMAKDWNKYNYTVYHIADFDYDKMERLETKKVETVKAKVDKNGIHIPGTSFSDYVVSITPKSGGTSSPATGESSVALNIALILAVISLAGVAAVFVKRIAEKNMEKKQMEQSEEA